MALQTHDRAALRQRLDNTPVRLSPHHLAILRMLARGASAAEIAVELHIATSTVNSYAAELRHRLGARNAAQAVAIGYELGLLRPGDSGATP